MPVRTSRTSARSRSGRLCDVDRENRKVVVRSGRIAPGLDLGPEPGHTRLQALARARLDRVEQPTRAERLSPRAHRLGQPIGIKIETVSRAQRKPQLLEGRFLEDSDREA